MRTLRVVAAFSDGDKAETLRGTLEEAGFHAVVADESRLQRYWFASKPLAGQKVMVGQVEFEQAREFLKITGAREHLLCGEIRCPECGSAEIEYPQFTRKFITTTLAEIFCLLHVIEKRFYCMSCHHTWPAMTLLRDETDILNWPRKHSRLVKQEQG